MKTIKLIYLGVFIISIFSLDVSAEEKPVENDVDLYSLEIEDLLDAQIVSAASKYSQESLKAPSSTTVITRDQIQKFGYRNLSELIRSVRSFYTTNDRNYSYSGIRGFGRPSDFDTRMLVLLNGHRMNDSVYASATLGSEFIVDIDLIEKVEIIRGPSSSIYGSNAFFAVMNIVTREASSIDGVEVSADAAKDNTFQGRTTYAKKFPNDMELVVSGTRFDSDGEKLIYFNEYDSPENNNGIAKNLDSEDGGSVFTQLKYGDFKLESGYVERDKKIPTGAYGAVFNDPNSQTYDSRFYADLTYEKEIGKDSKLDVRGYYDRYRYDILYPFADTVSGYSLSKDLAKGDRYGVQSQVISKVIDNNTIVAGGEFRSDFNQDQLNYNYFPERQNFIDSKEDENIFALYAQDDLEVFKWLTIHGGIRYDNYETVKDQFNPRLGLLFFPDESSAIKLLYGSAFRAPNAYELYYAFPGIQQQPQNLKSEEIDTYELILEKYVNKNTRLTLSFYKYEIDGLIDQVVNSSDDLTMFVNRDAVSAKGVEAEIESKFSSGWMLRSSYGYQETEDDSTNSLLTNSPRHMLKTNLIAPILEEKVFAGLETLYTSNRVTLSGGKADDYWLLNLTLYGKKIYNNLDVSTSLYNLLDQKYSDPGSNEHLQDTLPQAGITWRVQTTYRF